MTNIPQWAINGEFQDKTSRLASCPTQLNKRKRNQEFHWLTFE